MTTPSQPDLAPIRALTTAIADLNTQAEQAIAAVDKAREEASKKLLDHLAATGTVSIILIRGMTPSFNDGEPCTHSYDFWVNIEGIQESETIEECSDNPEEFAFLADLKADSYYDRQTMSSHEVLGARAHNREMSAANGHVYDCPPDEVMQAIGDIIAPAVDKAEGTDYWVSFILRDGVFVREDGTYQSDY